MLSLTPRPLTHRLARIGAASVWLWACGSTTDEGLFGDRPSGTGGTATAGAGGTADGAVNGSGGALPPDGGLTSGGTSGSASGGAGPMDSGADAPPDASAGGAEAGAGGGAPDVSMPDANADPAPVRCGNLSCDRSAGEVCCVDQDLTPPPAFSCVRNAESCDQHIECDDDSDCETGLCCLVPVPFSSSFQTECRSSCLGVTRLRCTSSRDCAPGQTCCGTPLFSDFAAVQCSALCTGVDVCHDNDDCPGGETCQPSPRLPAGFGTCSVF